VPYAYSPFQSAGELLSAEEVQAIENKGKGIRKLTEDQYDGALAGFEVGDYGEIMPDPDEKRLTCRNRLKAAASRRGLSLTFLRSSGEAMRFKVSAGDGYVGEQPEVVEPEPGPTPVSSDAPPKRRGGRPRKASV
jgi:hypothetical protein